MASVLILSPGSDVGGGGIALKRAFDLHPEFGWTARAVRRRDSLYRYPADIQWVRGKPPPEVVRLFRAADVIHVYEMPEIVQLFAGYQRKTIVVHHIGSRYRKDPDGSSARCVAVGAYEAIGSQELFRLAKGGELCIGCVSFETLAPYRAKFYQPSERVRIVHAPTNRNSKSTGPFLAACERLAKRYPIDVDLIWQRPWAECLERKARADILFDQVWYGYGANAIEAWAMGIPVVAGYRSPEARARTLADFGRFPFVEASEETIEQALEPLVADAALREYWGKLGHEFGQRVHSERATVERMVGLYGRAMAA